MDSCSDLKIIARLLVQFSVGNHFLVKHTRAQECMPICQNVRIQMSQMSICWNEPISKYKGYLSATYHGAACTAPHGLHQHQSASIRISQHQSAVIWGTLPQSAGSLGYFVSVSKTSGVPCLSQRDIWGYFVSISSDLGYLTSVSMRIGVLNVCNTPRKRGVGLSSNQKAWELLPKEEIRISI